MVLLVCTMSVPSAGCAAFSLTLCSVSDGARPWAICVAVLLSVGQQKPEQRKSSSMRLRNSVSAVCSNPGREGREEQCIVCVCLYVLV